MNEELKEVFRAKGETEAYIIKGKLEASGIPVILKGEAIGRVYGLTLDGLGEIKILVPSKFEKIALKLLSSTNK